MHYHSFLFSVMCKCSYLNEEEVKTRKKRIVLPAASDSSSQVTTPTNPKSSPSSSTSQREISTAYFSPSSSPREPRRSQALEERSTAWIAKDEARNGGSTPRTILPQLKRGKLKRRVTIGSTLSTSSGSGDVDEEADWPPFADEDYIVFCFEEDGAFHVMEESPKTTGPKLQCDEHGNLSCACSDESKGVNHFRLINRRDCLLPNKEAEEEMSDSPLSPQLHQDGTAAETLVLAKGTIMLGNELRESMECRNGSVECTDSSQSEDEEHFQIEHIPQVEQSSFSWNLISHDSTMDDIALRKDYLLPNTEVMEEDMFLSPKSKLGIIISIDDLLKGDNDISSIESDQSSGFSADSNKGDPDEQLEGKELATESAKSSVSNQSRSSSDSSDSFEFPVLEWAWVGSPVTWPRSGRLHFRKHKSRRLKLKCCKFI